MGSAVAGLLVVAMLQCLVLGSFSRVIVSDDGGYFARQWPPTANDYDTQLSNIYAPKRLDGAEAARVLAQLHEKNSDNDHFDEKISASSFDKRNPVRLGKRSPVRLG
uniref:Uncharacterized protein n=1 Tax=Plectus sambesii TaxID=2011161 RepID=A0A914UQJ2_9BILA